MNDIFISYASEDKGEIVKLVHALKSEGWSVWWDHEIPVGKSYEIVIEEALDEAKCVLVIWSKTSVKSHWVRTEAAEAQRQEKLFPLNLDGSNPPLVYRALQTADFNGWSSSTTAPVFQQLVTAIHNHIGKNISEGKSNQRNTFSLSEAPNIQNKDGNNNVSEKNNITATNTSPVEPSTSIENKQIESNRMVYILQILGISLLFGIIVFLNQNKEEVIQNKPVSEHLETIKKSLLAQTALKRVIPETETEIEIGIGIEEEYKNNIPKIETEYKARHILDKTTVHSKNIKIRWNGSVFGNRMPWYNSFNDTEYQNELRLIILFKNLGKLEANVEGLRILIDRDGKTVIWQGAYESDNLPLSRDGPIDPQIQEHRSDFIPFQLGGNHQNVLFKTIDFIPVNVNKEKKMAIGIYKGLLQIKESSKDIWLDIVNFSFEIPPDFKLEGLDKNGYVEWFTYNHWLSFALLDPKPVTH